MTGDSEIFIWREGKEEGPFSPRALEGAIRLGSIRPETPAWTRSNRKWKTAADILRNQPVVMAPPLHPPSPPDRAATAPQKERVSPKPVQARWLAGVGLAFAFGSIVIYVILHSKGGESRSVNGETPWESGDQPSADDASDLDSRVRPAVVDRLATSLGDSENCVLMARTEEHSGTAFIACENGRAYVYTNVHVASAKNLAFTNFRGVPVSVGERGEVAGISVSTTEEMGVDIVRFPLVETPGLALKFASRSRIEQKPEVWTLGDSGGESILLTLKGRVKGVGPSKIEVDCEFIKGNSGGPIVTADGEVVGIASYMTTDPSIWAEGTEQEIRRIGWIPGKKFRWRSTSTAELADEQSMIFDCVMTSDLLRVISLLETGKEGFLVPDEMPEAAVEITSLTTNHPLRGGLEETNRTILALSKRGGSSWAASHREYVRFFKSCLEYQTTQLEKAGRTIKSSFWRHQLDSNMQNHREILKTFRSLLSRFERFDSGTASLSDS
jgi:hypothetical protein